MFGSVIESYEKALKSLALRRLLTYSTMAAICIIIGFGCAAGYAFFRLPAGQTSAEIALWGVLASLIASAVGLGVTWRRDDYHETKKRIADQHMAQLQRQTDTAITGLTASHKFNCLDEASLSARIGMTYSAISDIAADDAWQREADRQYEVLRSLYVDLISLHSRYLVAVDGLVEALVVFFNDAEKNVLALKRISDEARNRAIQPSFRLLAHTDRKLRELKEAIEGIEFS